METPRRYPLIFNPKARSQKGGRVLRFLMDHAHRFVIYATNHAGEARELAARFAAEGEAVVVVAGGDGTLNEVVCGLAGSATVMGILPAGTMNVFAREMGIPCDSLDRAFAVIERGLIHEIDLFAANDAPFVQMAGVGFDAAVIEVTTWHAKKRLGPLAYLLAAVKVLGEQPPNLEVICGDGRRESGVAVLAGNGSLYGGPFRFFRKANNRDSKLEVLVYKESGYRLVLDSLRGLTCGGIDMLDSIRYLQTESFIVRADREVPVEVDGEWLGRFTEVEFKETPHHLRVIAPEVLSVEHAERRWKWLWPWSRGRAGLADSALPDGGGGAPRKGFWWRRRWPRWIGRVVLILIMLVVAMVGYANFTAIWASRGRIFTEVEQVPKTRIGLVFGTTDRVAGRENRYFRYRIDAATEVWRAGKVETLIVSGDNSTRYYNEPNKMKQALIERGIPGERIVCDFAGLRTLDSVVRAKEVFGADSILFISQRFQNERAIYLAQANGMTAYGFDARDVETQGGIKTKLREIGARVKMWLDVNFLNTRPRHLGDKVVMPD